MEQIEQENKEQETRSVEEAFQDLDEMVEKLESRDISLEDSFRIYQEGMKLLQYCSKKIDTVEKKMLQMNEDGSFREF